MGHKAVWLSVRLYTRLSDIKLIFLVCESTYMTYRSSASFVLVHWFLAMLRALALYNFLLSSCCQASKSRRGHFILLTQVLFFFSFFIISLKWLSTFDEKSLLKFVLVIVEILPDYKWPVIDVDLLQRLDDYDYDDDKIIIIRTGISMVLKTRSQMTLCLKFSGVKWIIQGSKYWNLVIIFLDICWLHYKYFFVYL